MVACLRTLHRQVTGGAKGCVAGNVNCILIGREDKRIEQEARLVRSLGNYLCAWIDRASVKNNEVFSFKICNKTNKIDYWTKEIGATCKKTIFFCEKEGLINKSWYIDQYCNLM